MKIDKARLKVLIYTVSCLFVSGVLASYGQTLETNTKQNLIITSPGFYLFSSISNDDFKKNVKNDPNIDLTFSNFLGSPCGVSPGADFGNIGPEIVVRGNGTVTLDFSMAGPTAGSFGLTFSPQGGACIFDLFITPPTPPVADTTTSSSSSGGTTQAASNTQLIQNAIDLETVAKVTDLALGTSGFSVQLAIDKIEMSLTNINELSDNLSTSMTGTASIEKNIHCITSKDTQTISILEEIKDETPTSNSMLFTSSISKAKNNLQKALKCKKTIQRTIKN